MTKIIFIWYVVTGVIIPTEKVNDKQTFTIKQKTFIMRTINLIIATIFLIISSLMTLLVVVSVLKNDVTGFIITLLLGVFFIYVTYVVLKFNSNDNS